MRITCPSCGADYDVPASRLTPRKMVRCVRCQAEWVPAHVGQEAELASAEQAQFASQIEPLPAVTAMDRLAASQSAPPSSPALLVAWILTLVVLAGTLAATVTWRGAIMQAWPQSALILAPFGQPAPAPAQTAGRTTG